MEPAAILVLGARVRPGELRGALRRRVDAAVAAASRWPDALVVACGGRGWDGRIEADVMARALAEAGVDPARLRRDRLSLTTRENLEEGSALVRRASRTGSLAITTCDWHLERALTIGRAMGLDVVGVPAIGPKVHFVRAARRRLFERLSLALDLLFVTRPT